jgi:hypothetical protein
MSYINWGSESPEQVAIRKQIEEQALYEQAVRATRARSRSGNTPGAAAGGGGYLALVVNILTLTVDSTESLAAYWCVTSSAPTTFTVDWGDSVIEEYTANGAECFGHTYATGDIWNVVITFANPALITELEFND